MLLFFRYTKRETDSGEKGALRGLIALAVSDMFFCVGIIPYAFYDGFKTIFYDKTIWLYYQVGGKLLVNGLVRFLGKYYSVIIAAMAQSCSYGKVYIHIYHSILFNISCVFYNSPRVDLAYND